MANKRINRRRFLKKTAGIAAGVIGFPYIVSSSALGKDGKIVASERIVMGVIGTGKQGMNGPGCSRCGHSPRMVNGGTQ